MRDLFEESMNELLVVDIRKSLAAGMKATILRKGDHVIDLIKKPSFEVFS